ncbi:hypothetical protein CSE_06540 [Caldisericum exile AZM16c01]|uniref:Uncharacterized protein n=1 Tax=Caldisericum exile (strain DSM 21853 / NBRC 104410 / AZM16c01) TaxID=511051 RepID=A0A7U6JFZ0_CALEA|nr:hypothetical protein CSE_06540 [Caldisericum exile AZM16c01]
MLKFLYFNDGKHFRIFLEIELFLITAASFSIAYLSDSNYTKNSFKKKS